VKADDQRPDLASLLDSWAIQLRADGKAPGTLSAYLGGVRAFLRWCEEGSRVASLDRRTVSAWVASLLDAGQEGATAVARQLAVRRFSAWLAEEGEIPRDELVGLKPPRIDVKLVHPLSEAQLRALFDACTVGPDVFRNRRDEAIARLMNETGLRAGEAVALEIGDVDLAKGEITVRRGKGGKGRRAPIGPQTVRALDRYMRVRRTHRLARTDALWLGGGGKAFGYQGLHKALGERAALAGIEGFHPHRLRHSLAHRWLAAGGTEHGLMAVAGWSRADMLSRYTRAQAEERAAEEARRLRLGDL
jgi:site-specific recombinase XerD